jgi:IS30 family transposase
MQHKTQERKRQYRKSYHRLPEEVRREIIRRAARGELQRDIAAALSVSQQVVSLVLLRFGGVIRLEDWQISTSRLSLEERVEIAMGRQRHESLRSIARRLGRSPSTITREIKRNRLDRKHGYRPVAAHKLAYRRSRRPKLTKLATNPVLRERVISDLERTWSPEQISRRLREDFSDDKNMQISHETIYKTLFIQGRGELRRELKRCLRTGRAKRLPRAWTGNRRRMIPNMVMITERPSEAADRAVPGHWEGDLLMGRDNKTAVGTLVERSTRFTMLVNLPVDHSAPSVRDAMAHAITTLPEALRRSLTWDQGPEMAEHVQFTIDTGVQVYFCDPHAPWQRGSNENTNGLLRQFFPKGTDIPVRNPKRLQEVADLLNGRPRKTLGWRTPAEKLAEVVATIG